VPTTFVLPEEDGTTVIYGWLKDEAGNIAPLGNTATRILDTQDPTATLTGVPGLTRVRTIPITLDGADAGGITGYFLSEDGTTPALEAQGWAAIPPASFTISSAGDGLKAIHAWTKDVAGRISERADASAMLDSTPPGVGLTAPKLTRSRTIAVGVTGEGAPSAYIVSNSASPPSPGDSRWHSVPPKTFLLPAGDGLKRVYAFARDAAGNVSAAAVATVTLDTNAPVARIKAPVNGAKPAGFAAIRGVATDGTSGVAGVWVALRRQAKAACAWWDGGKWVERGCGAKLWVKLNGTTAWALRFPRVTTPASYLAFAYAIDAAGNRQAAFAPGVNRVAFRIPASRRK
jgi:hypothetical protein